MARPLKSLVAMGLVRREVPFGDHPRTGKRTLYRIDDPFLRLWFRVIAPHRAALCASPPETRLRYWRRYRRQLEGYAWEELCRMAVPWLHRSNHPVADMGPFEPARRYWRGDERKIDVVAPAFGGKRLLVGEAKWSATAADVSRWSETVAGLALPDSAGKDLTPVVFVASANELPRRIGGADVLDARAVLGALR